MKDYTLQLIMQEPINYNGLIFYPVEFCEICETVGLDNFNTMLIPFLITKDALDIDEEKVNTVDLFDDVILNDSTLLNSFCLLLRLFCRYTDIELIGNVIHLTLENGDTFDISSSNYNDICDIVMKINAKDKIHVEKIPKGLSPKQKEIWLTIHEGRKKENEKNAVHIYDVLNVCEFGGSYHISMNEIKHWTLWKIMNCYKARLNMKTYDDNLKLCLVSGDGKSISDKNHWHNKLMIRDEKTADLF